MNHAKEGCLVWEEVMDLLTDRGTDVLESINSGYKQVYYVVCEL